MSVTLVSESWLVMPGGCVRFGIYVDILLYKCTNSTIIRNEQVSPGSVINPHRDMLWF